MKTLNLNPEDIRGTYEECQIWELEQSSWHPRTLLKARPGQWIPAYPQTEEEELLPLSREDKLHGAKLLQLWKLTEELAVEFPANCGFLGEVFEKMENLLIDWDQAMSKKYSK